jgi:hypothetical protein
MQAQTESYVNSQIWLEVPTDIAPIGFAGSSYTCRGSANANLAGTERTRLEELESVITLCSPFDLYDDGMISIDGLL